MAPISVHHVTVRRPYAAQTGRTHRRQDQSLVALPPGLRVVRVGNRIYTYYEARANRNDRNRRVRL